MDPQMIDKTVYIYIEGFVACTMASQWASQLMDIMENIEGEKSGKRANENMDIMGEWLEYVKMRREVKRKTVRASGSRTKTIFEN